MKKCSKCFLSLPFTDFPKEKSRKDGHYPWCKKCLSSHRKARYVQRPRKVIIERKVCSLCNEDKPRSSFNVYKGGNLHYRCKSCEKKEEDLKKSGLILCTTCNTSKEKTDFIPSRRNEIRSQCKECAKEYTQSNKAKIKNSNLLKYYGITLKQYNDLLKNQKYKCAVCKRHHTEFKNMLAVDHAHGGNREGSVRGLLCDTCNRFIVWRHNDSELLRSAADYLDSDYTGFFVPKDYIKSQKRKRRRKKKK